MPASYALLSAFIACHIGKQAGSTGYLAFMVGIPLIIHLGMVMIDGYTFARQLPLVRAPLMKSPLVLQHPSITFSYFGML
jgi:hypothetical protein